MRAVVVDERKHSVANYHAQNMKSFLDLMGAMGLSSPAELTPAHIVRRTANEVNKTYDELYPFLRPGELLDASEIDPHYAKHWEMASADRF